MTYRCAISYSGAVAPRLYPVTADEVVEDAQGVVFPACLVDCWLEIGNGFFTEDIRGERITGFDNRLLAPGEIAELRESIAPPSYDPFEFGVPFFETADENYLVLRPDGAVAHQTNIVVSFSLEEFLRCVVAAPEFWLAVMENAGSAGL